MGDSTFKVYTVTDGKDGKAYCHWATGLTMFIQKNGVEIKLTPEEVQELVKTLPRTVGGKY